MTGWFCCVYLLTWKEKKSCNYQLLLHVSSFFKPPLPPFGVRSQTLPQSRRTAHFTFCCSHLKISQDRRFTAKAQWSFAFSPLTHSNKPQCGGRLWRRLLLSSNEKVGLAADNPKRVLFLPPSDYRNTTDILSRRWTRGRLVRNLCVIERLKPCHG